MSLRKYSKADPWKVSVPDLVMMLTTEPAAKPTSALKLLVCTCTSEMASIEGETPMSPCARTLLSMPSIISLLYMSAWPLAETVEVAARSLGRFPEEMALGDPAFTPGCTCPRLMKLRPLAGRACPDCSVTVPCSVEL